MLVGQSQVRARLGGVHERQAMVRVVGIPDLLEHGLEALRGAFELPAVEVEDALVVTTGMPPLHQRRQECHPVQSIWRRRNVGTSSESPREPERPHCGRPSRRCHAGVESPA